MHTFKTILDPAFALAASGRIPGLAVGRGARSLHRRLHAVGAVRVVPDQSGDPQIVPGWRRARSCANHPVGTGPYRFVRHLPDDRRRAGRVRRLLGRPIRRTKALVLRIVPDEVMRGLELRKGTIDIVVNDVSPDILHQLRRDEQLQTATAPGVDYQYIGINLRDPALGDVRVRRALAHAIDRQAIVDYLRRGLATPADGLIPPIALGLRARHHVVSFDPARARQLLDEAGYRDPDGDGPAPRLRLTLKTSNIEFNRLQAAVVQQDLRARGHRARRPHLRVRDAVRRRRRGQLSALFPAVGRRRAGRSRHPAPRVPLVADAAARASIAATSAIRRSMRCSTKPRRRLDPITQAGGASRRFNGSSRERCPTSACGTRRTSRSRSGRSPAFASRRSPTSISSSMWRAPALLRLISLLVAGAGRRTAVRGDSRFDPVCASGSSATEHFVIYFHRGEEHLAARLARIAEETRPAGSRRSACRRQRRTHVVLADQSELANGWATPLPYNTITIGAAAPSGSELIGNTDDWLRAGLRARVHAHRPPRSIAGLVARWSARVFGRTPLAFPNLLLPTWQIEGLATFEESRLTSMGRLHAGRLSRDRARSGAERRPPAARSRQRRADQLAGRSCAVRLWRRLSRVPRRISRAPRSSLQLADATTRRVPYFTAGAFSKVFGKSLDELWQRLSRSASPHARRIATARKPAQRLTHHGYEVVGPRFLRTCAGCPWPKSSYSVRTPARVPQPERRRARRIERHARSRPAISVRRAASAAS